MAYHLPYRAALGLMLTLVAPSLLRAQQDLVVSARIGVPSRPLAGADSGRVVLLLSVNGLTDAQQRVLKPSQVQVVDGNGVSYAPSGVARAARDQAPGLLVQFTDMAQGVVHQRQYLFLVPPGPTTFELRLPSHAPIPFTPSRSQAR